MSGEIHPSAFPSAQHRYVPGCRPHSPAARLRAPLRYCGGNRFSRLTSVIPTRRLRNSEMVLILISAVIGAVVGLGVVLLHDFVGYLHHVVFGLGEGRYLSEGVGIAPATMVLAPALGGLLVGTLMFFVRRWRPGDIVDPIEANALFGGKMSLIDSFRLTVSTVISNACGASVGMEAAYTQTGSGLSSALGQTIRLRRGDLRILTGCGAAAAIAAAFNAPLAGAFYAFELVIGSYTLAALAPVAVAALTATVVARATIGVAPIFSVDASTVGVSAAGLRRLRPGGLRVGLARHPDHAGGDGRRARVPPHRSADLASSGIGRIVRRPDSAVGAAGAGQRPRSAPEQPGREAGAAGAAHHADGEDPGVGGVAGGGVPGRSVQFVAVPRQPVRRPAGPYGRHGLSRAGGRRYGVHAGRHGIGGGRDHRRSGDHGDAGAGKHRRFPGDGRRADRRRGVQRGRPQGVRLLLRDMAFPPARRADPRRP